MEFKRVINLDFSGCKGLFLFGPRQTGKSYWLRKTFPRSLYYDLLMSDSYFKYFRFPHLLREELLVRKVTGPVIIDEVQKIPALLDEVHYLMEKHNIRFILTGSSARKLKRGGANLLGGRALYQRLFPLVSPEIPKLDLDRILCFGSLPAIYQSTRPRSLLKSYVKTYLKEEVQAEGLVRHLQSFSLFTDLAAKTNTELVNYSNLASDVGVSSNTIKEYYRILEDTFIGSLLPPYKKTMKRKPVSMNKFYFFDIGVVNALNNHWSVKRGTTEFGRLFEHFIFNEIKAYLQYSEDDRQLSFWRSKNKQEVDFVVGDNMAVEVKAAQEVRSRDLKGLKALCEEGPFPHRIVVSFEKKPRLTEQKILVLPYREFLKRLWNGELT